MRRDAPLFDWVDAVSAPAALENLSPALRAWFTSVFGTPTMAQRLAWPILVQRRHLLLSTPTGSGKTLAAFLPLLDRLHAEPPAGLRCLYIAPLKALCHDVRKNLRAHVRGFRNFLGQPPLPFRVGLRTGDTPQRVRRRYLAEPPPVLLTTPESLALMLSHPHADELFSSLRWVVVDEVHALVGSKRGADLALSLERLDHLVGPEGLQRIGLSATCAPLETAAEFLVGVGRPCAMAQAADRGAMELTVEPLPASTEQGFMAGLVERIAATLGENKSTLIFTNTRSLAERVTWALRRRYPERVLDVASHHSSLALARRRAVERRLKHGKLWAVVSSTSLELGIDIGSVDGVVFVHPPGGVVRMLQRLGRSGHQPEQPRRGLVLTASDGELLEATVTAASTRHGQIEPIRGAAHPLDMLCQHLLGLAMTGTWTAADAYALFRRAAPYRELSWDDFGACLDYLSGRDRTGAEWLPPRLRWQGDAFTIVNEATARLLRRNLGSILTEDASTVRLLLPGGEEIPRTSLVGEVDEAYAERLEPGDRFVLDGRCLEVKRFEKRAVLVEEVMGRPLVPRWRGAGVPMPGELARRLFLFRVEAAEALRDGEPALARLLHRDYYLSDAATAALACYIRQQESVSEIPDLRMLLIEHVGMQSCAEFYIHTPLARAANETLAGIVARRWQRAYGSAPVALAADLGFLLSVDAGTGVEVARWRQLLGPAHFATDAEDWLREGPLLRQSFGRVCQTGLMVLRQPLGRRPRVGGAAWAERQLFEQIETRAPDFVLLRQAQREAEDNGDLATALAFLEHCAELPCKLRRLTQPSPFGETLLRAGRLTSEVPPEPAEALQRFHEELFQKATD
jgi:ATP-dependent helicase Lhr and Lhr-like helicase